MVRARRSVGTLPWARLTGGQLRPRDYVTLLADAIVARLNARLRRRQEAAFVPDPTALRIPDSPLAVHAGELLVTSAEPWLAHHCFRTYLWAAILGQKERLRYDEEVLFVAAALHDIGLTSTGAALWPERVECFAVRGAFAAENLLGAAEPDRQRRAAIAEAICLHLNVRVPLQLGVEAYLLHEGAAYDVVGARYGEVAERARDAVLAEYPRQAMKAQFAETMKRQSGAHPRSRAAFLCSHGFIGLIRRAPFVERP